jgi:uncharacterized damage-inducible protein DinB
MSDDVQLAPAASRAAVLAAFAHITEAELDRRPADGEWSAWEIAYHLLDIERWYIAKLCEATAPPRLAGAPDRTAALARLLAVWARLREETLALARAVPPERLDQAGLLSGVPDWTPRRLLRAIVTHDHEHAAQVRAARGMEQPGEGGSPAASERAAQPMNAPPTETN